MRCLIKLRARQEQVYRPAYHVKVQGLVYDILRQSGYDFVHQESPFKFVTFSNVFPPRDMSKGEKRTWIIASPHEDLIESVSDVVSQMDEIEVGDQRYWVDYTSTFSITPEQSGHIITGTPIVVRIPASRCERYGIEPEYDDVYWQLEHPTDAFIEEIERNLGSKYRNYYDEQPPERPYFTKSNPMKEVAVPLHYSDAEVQIIGTTWKFEYECRTRPMYRLMGMAYSAGLGELNTTGFGFVNDVSDGRN